MDVVCDFDSGVIDYSPLIPIRFLRLDRELLGRPRGKMSMDSLKHAYWVLNRDYEINLHHKLVHKFRYCDILIYPQKLSRYETFSTGSPQEIVKLRCH